MRLNADGSIKLEHEVEQYDLSEPPPSTDQFGFCVAALHDDDGDGVVDLAVGAPGTGDGGAAGSEHGSIWTLRINGSGTSSSLRTIPTLSLNTRRG